MVERKYRIRSHLLKPTKHTAVFVYCAEKVKITPQYKYLT